MRRPGLRVALAAALLAFSPSAAAKPLADSSWTSFGHDDQLTNFTDAPGFTVAAAKRLEEAWTATLDGPVVASPLVASIAGGGPAVFVATEAGSVYALSAADGTLLWRRSFGSVEAGRGCGTWGITSTGVVDRASGLLYVANADGLVHALALASGAEAPGWPVRVTDRPATEYVWGGLRIAGGRLLVPLASYCDEPDADGVPAEGRLVGIPLVDPAAPPAVFDPAPGYGNLAGIWGWGGVSIAPDGSALYTGVGNSEPEPDETQGYGESLVELTPDLATVIASSRPFTPGGPVDTDLGGAPVIFRPVGCPALAAVNSKSGSLYVWRLGDLAAGPVLALPVSDGVDAFVGEPSWSPRTGMLYDAGATFERAGRPLGAGILALRITPACGLRAVWSAVAGEGSQPPPLVAGDVVFAAGGSGGYEALNAREGSVLWRFSTGDAPTWGPLVEARDTVFAGDLAGRVYAFRARPGSLRGGRRGR